MDDPHFSYKQKFVKKNMVLNVKWYIGLVLGFGDKQEAIYIYIYIYIVQGWPQGEGIHKMRGLGWGNSWVQPHIVGMSPPI
jgi:hypothetical protein